MAHIKTIKTKTGVKYRAYVCVNGLRDDRVKSTRQKAKSWASDRESELRKLSCVEDDTYTLSNLFKRYVREVSPKKKGARWERIRLAAFQTNYRQLCSIKLTRLQREDIECWMDTRMTEVKPSTVNRELNLVSHCLTQARRWRLMSHNPFQDLQRPKDPPPRFRRITPNEIESICQALHYQDDTVLTQKRQFTAVAWLFAMETCMRQGEICQLTALTVNKQTAVAHLPNTKNGFARDVPLSPQALALLDKLPTPETPHSPLFQSNAKQMSALFGKYCKRASIDNLVFHDSRHEAITRLVDSNRYNVLEVAAITGHRDINELLTYYNKTAEQIAAEMAQQATPNKPLQLPGLNNLNDLSKVAGLKELVQEVLLEQARLTSAA